MDFKFGKEYKLCSKKNIDTLFAEGRKLRQFPFSMVVNSAEHHTPPFKILIVVPKKNIRKAHDRNYLKRCVRESIRKNKHILESALNEMNKKINFAFIYTQREISDFHQLEKSTEKALKKLILELHENE